MDRFHSHYIALLVCSVILLASPTVGRTTDSPREKAAALDRKDPARAETCVIRGRFVTPQPAGPRGGAARAATPIPGVLIWTTRSRSLAPVEQASDPPRKQTITLHPDRIEPRLTLGFPTEELWIHNATPDTQQVTHLSRFVPGEQQQLLTLRPNERRQLILRGEFIAPEAIYWLGRPQQVAWFILPSRRFAALSGDDGRFELGSLQPGAALFWIRHPGLDSHETIRIEGESVGLDGYRFTLNLAPGVHDLGDVEVPVYFDE